MPVKVNERMIKRRVDFFEKQPCSLENVTEEAPRRLFPPTAFKKLHLLQVKFLIKFLIHLIRLPYPKRMPFPR